MTQTNFLQQVGVPHCNFCHKCHSLKVSNSIVCNDGGVIYTIASEPTPCTKDCKMYDGTPVLKPTCKGNCGFDDCGHNHISLKLKMKIVVYATNKDGDGFVQKVGEYDELEDIEIRVGHFADDIVISFEVKNEKDD